MSENNFTAMLPAPVEETQGRNLPIPLDVYRSPNFNPNLGPEGDAPVPAVPLSHYLWLLRRHWWKIVGFVALSVTAAVIVSSRLVPIYESTAIIDIDRQMPSAIIGQESTRTMANDSDQFLSTQVKLIQSDAVLRPVVQKFKLMKSEADSLDANPAKAT